MKGGCVNHEANGFWMFCIFSSDGNYISRDEIACFLSFNLQLARAFSIRLSFCSIEMGGFFFPCWELLYVFVSTKNFHNSLIQIQMSWNPKISIEWTTSTTLGYSYLVLLRDIKRMLYMDALQIHINSVPCKCLVF